ncbi:MAG: DUF2309 domain-containing protein [Elusimicrobia bacterium]|nr:DUF2309 domain-containing protein [Elusimicrobiota bacterium]
MPTPSPGDDAQLGGIIDRVAHLLPAQGPISIFIHHNTLHAFESLPFEQAVVDAGEKFGCKPFLSEEEYRAEFDRGRINDQDLDSALRWELGSDAARPVVGTTTRLESSRRVLRYGIPDAAGPALSWLLRETSALRRFRDDLPPDAREAADSARGPGAEDPALEETNVRALWEACVSAVTALGQAPAAIASRPPRLRDLLMQARGVDTDAWIHPVLIRVVGAFLDQGLAHWSMPGRQRGLYDCFIDLYSHPWARFCGRWAAQLPPLLRQERRFGHTPLSSVRLSLDALGIEAGEREAYLEATALALRGWAGMIRQLQKRPDRVPARSLPASLEEFLAVSLLLERAALLHIGGKATDCSGFFKSLRASSRAPEQASLEDRAWPLFHAAQLCGLGAAQVAALSAAQVAVWEAYLRDFSSIKRRRILHGAYERHLRSRLCDALTQYSPAARPEPPSFQAIFCLDEREESFRRHLEEAAPGVETFGTAGFFGVAMYYQGATDAHPRPLCPIVVQPHHYVGEVKVDPSSAAVRWRRFRRREAGRFGKALHFGSATLLRGAVVTAVLGPLSIIPLIVRVLFPRLSRWIGTSFPLETAPATRLRIDREKTAPPIGLYYGYTKQEMAGIVGSQLRNLGLIGRLAPLVIMAGHGSVSLNNPHESAHDCGACGGGRGGPNARVFAAMANDPAVRDLLAQDGIRIPKDAWFIGAQRNSCDNSVEFYDLDFLPENHRVLFERAATAFTRARRREAHERCRRFESFSGGFGAALSHAEARSHDLAQPRPEYGHATNAFCIVGRRDRTRALFLDRRAFLVSYDPARDDGQVLEGILRAVIPVVAGISLEYYFSRVDPTGYGCGTKLPHNIACLLGVMDGAQSDLRTGLPWQMVEIHEPVRLFVVVECRPERFDRVLEDQPDLRALLDRRWIFAACLDPASNALWLREGSAYQPWSHERELPRVIGGSLAWYRDKRGHLPIAGISDAQGKGATA